MSKECPHCKEKIEYLEGSKQIEKPQIYPPKQEADRDIESMKLMTPENIYEAVEVG